MRQHPLDLREWATGPVSRQGAARYVHLIRAPWDPPELTRKERQNIDRDPTRWKKTFADVAVWRDKIFRLLCDGKARSFNAIVLELTDRYYTADAAFDKGPDFALWALVDEGEVEHTTYAPIMFRRRQ